MSRIFVTFSMIVLLAAGCTNRGGAEHIAQAATAAPSGAAAQKAKILHIVFVEKEKACACTRKTIDAGWNALQAALGPQNQIPIERIQIDVDAKKVELYQAKRAFVALPAIYFLAASDSLVDMLQGEITEAQVSSIVK